MNMKETGYERRRTGRRRFAVRRKGGRAAAAAVLIAALLAAGVYFVGHYISRMEYARYPLRYEQQIIACAQEFELDPWHIAAVVCCESGFRPEAVSGVGARGLMQIMPDTGLWLAGKFDEEDSYTDELLFTPETNLKYGCWYLSWLLNRYGGDLTLTTAAYHAGHGTVDKWLADPGVSADGQTLGHIPYDSTDVYVKRVLAACEKYRELYSFGADENA